MDNLSYEISKITKRSKEGSYATQTARHKLLMQSSKELKQLGFRHLELKHLKAKHVYALVNYWQAKELAAKTLANRLSAIRWLSDKINKPEIVKKENEAYHIPARSEITTVSKAETLTQSTTQSITDIHTQFSLKLQQHFGLRRQEAIKFTVNYADLGDKIRLKKSWTKGGRYREVPITTEEQRHLLDQIRQFVGKQSLIPAHKIYKQQLKTFEYQTSKVDFTHTHGLRHAYALRRYKELAGLEAPCNGGPSYKELTDQQRRLALTARAQISQELGHNRIRVTNTYLGK